MKTSRLMTSIIPNRHENPPNQKPAMLPSHIWLRSESKPAEHRTVLTPDFAGQMVAAGFDLTVERSSQSVFDCADYETVGCRIVSEHSWKTDAPKDAIILGLKELEESAESLCHRHIHFAHVYKEQAGWRQFLSRFQDGGGTLYDLEFLVDESGRRVAAFGHWAGFAGAALAVLAFANHKSGQTPVLGPIAARKCQSDLIAEIKRSIEGLNEQPTALVIGAKGRCGRGAIELLETVGARVTAWDIEETKSGGPFNEILEHDIFLNCVFVESSIPPFIDANRLDDPGRTLSVVCDVSCDPYGTYNPVPIYDRCTTFDDPVLTVVESDRPLYLIAIDHLPSLLPKESSIDFCEQLLPHLLQLDNLDSGVWKRAKELFESKIATIGSGT